MQDRMENLEIKYLYLQKNIDDLNSVVIDQQKEIRELRQAVLVLSRKLQELTVPQPVDPWDEKPPHY